MGFEPSLRFPAAAFTFSTVAQVTATTCELDCFNLFGNWITLMFSTLTLALRKGLSCNQNLMPELVTGFVLTVFICDRFPLVDGAGSQLGAWCKTLKDSLMTCK